MVSSIVLKNVTDIRNFALLKKQTKTQEKKSVKKEKKWSRAKGTYHSDFPTEASRSSLAMRQNKSVMVRLQ